MFSQSKSAMKSKQSGLPRSPSNSSLSGIQHNASASRTERIPSMLQAVFLRSNRGEEVHKAPPQRLGQRTFFGNWWFKRTSKFDEKQKKLYDKKQDKVLVKTGKKMIKQQSKVLAKSASSLPQVSETAVLPPPPPKEEKPEYTLQEYFDSLLKERGYDMKLYNTLETGYSNKPSPLQIASHGPRMVQIVRDGNVLALRETLAVGLSPNPCNQFGESLLHMICRRGDKALLDVMLEAGSLLSVSDDYGRTPLHDAFWSAKPSYDVVSTILKRDAGLFFLKDKRGALPLSYVTKTHWQDWMDWFDANIDNYFPESQAKTWTPRDLVLVSPNTFGIADPKSDLGLELIQMVARGDLSPHEARLVAENAGRGDEEDEATVADTIGDETLDDSDFDSDDDSDFDSDFDSDYDSDEDETEDYSNSELDMLNEGDLKEMLRMAEMARQSEMNRTMAAASAS